MGSSRSGPRPTPVDPDLVRELYADVGSVHRVARIVHTHRRRVVAIVRDMMRPARFDSARQYPRKQPTPKQWRCDCGCVATGKTCYRGHAAPWVEAA